MPPKPTPKPKTRNPQRTEADRIARQRLDKGDYQPLWDSWSHRDKADRLLRQQGRDPSILNGIPDHWSHPKIQGYMQANGWDVATIPNDKIQALANRIRQRVDEALELPQKVPTNT